jgi:hypothetical protein
VTGYFDEFGHGVLSCRYILSMLHD